MKHCKRYTQPSRYFKIYSKFGSQKRNAMNEITT